MLTSVMTLLPSVILMQIVSTHMGLMNAIVIMAMWETALHVVSVVFPESILSALRNLHGIPFHVHCVLYL